ncbi:MAG TPA: hypothetical protein VFM12_04450, partial [Gemmatimonadales bacterium]|nr:hypothetical protein [Gemmatimonadales bacterium]
MDWSMTHLHLMGNHLPVFGSVIAIVILLWGLLARRRDIVTVALALTVLTGIGAFVARQTGHEAEEQVEDSTWANRRLIHEHEEAADAAFIVAAITGAVALIALFLRRGGGPGVAWISWLVLLGLLLTAAALAKTALYGGYIRHAEVRPTALDTMPPPRSMP